MEEDEDFDLYYEHLQLGCLGCGAVFPSNELYGGRCPICESSEITTFEDVLDNYREHLRVLKEMGLDTEED